MTAITSQTSQADEPRTSESSSECLSSANGQTSHSDAWEALLNAACSDSEGSRSLTDPQGSDSQDRTPRPPSHHQNSQYDSWPQRSRLGTDYKVHDGIHDDGDATPTSRSAVNSKQQTPLGDPQREGDAFSLYNSDKENLLST